MLVYVSISTMWHTIQSIQKFKTLGRLCPGKILISRTNKQKNYRHLKWDTSFPSNGHKTFERENLSPHVAPSLPLSLTHTHTFYGLFCRPFKQFKATDCHLNILKQQNFYSVVAESYDTAQGMMFLWTILQTKMLNHLQSSTIYVKISLIVYTLRRSSTAPCSLNF